MKRPLSRARERIGSVWSRLSGSLWFIPAIIVTLSIALAIALIELSGVIENKALAHFPRIFGASPEGSRSVLSTIAGSIMTVAGVTFSIMVVAVSQLTTLYTPRVLRTFMRDRVSQVTLGVMMGVFVYCLVVLRTIRSEEPGLFIPSIAVVGALLFALLAVGLLVYFIHHVASSLEVGRILASITHETEHAIDRLFPQTLGRDLAEAPDELLGEAVQQHRWRTICARRSGYIQLVDTDALAQCARDANIIIRMELAVGDFAVEGAPLVAVAGASVDDAWIEQLDSLFILDSYRTTFQDAAFGVRQMVDIALTALSPGINDPTTATTALRYLSVVLVRVASRRIPGRLRYVDGQLAVIARGPTFDSLLDLAFTEIIWHAREQPRLLETLRSVLQLVSAAAHPQDREIAVRQLQQRVDHYLAALPVTPHPVTHADLAS